MAEPTEVIDVIGSAVKSAGLGPVRALEPAGAGAHNRVWLVDTDQRAVVVRLMASAERMAMEQAIIERAADAGVPTAPVLWAAEEPQAVMVQHRAKGIRLADATPTDELLGSVGEVLRAIHRIPVTSGFGNLGPELVGATERLSTWFTDHVRAEAERVALHGATLVAAHDSLDALDAHRSLLDAQTPALAHGDFSPVNLLVDDHAVTCVLDWEAAKSGPPEFDLGWWDWFGSAFATPWSGDALARTVDTDRPDSEVLRELVVRRIWTRELLAGVRRHDEQRTAAALTALEPS